MKRRKFITNVVKASTASIVMPYILPTGRLFAAAGSQMADHVVFVLFAGGMRQQETILQRYLDDSQGVNFPGNIMYNLFNGAAPTDKIVYGTDGAVPGLGDVPIPKILSQTFQQQGTIFKEMRSATTGHYGGLNGLLQGNTLSSQGLKRKPINPTIFEYVRKHLNLKATDTWFIGNGIMNSVPLLNYSLNEDYGVKYGANFIAPNVVFGNDGQKHLSNAKVYDQVDELEPMYKTKEFLDNVWGTVGSGLVTIDNTEQEKYDIKEFLKYMYANPSAVDMPAVSDNGDATTIGYALEIMKWFKPKLSVVNLNNVDVCHSNFTSYLRAVHRADHSLAHLWDKIQSIPSMAGNTIMIAIPECGRNLDSNAIHDFNDFYAFDHSDQNARRIFGMMVGKNVPANNLVGSENNPIGNATDGVLTIADIFGIKGQIPTQYLAANSMSMFDNL
ncbi:MAG: hypothetical protein H8E84_04170 [Flavobacteriales bacterium]|nr:hypothetical protein [Flavobacteriales bacterium]